MGTWDRSWALTKMSFDVMRQDSEMIFFPILAAISSILYIAALIVPTFVLDLAHQANVPGVSPLQYVVLFLTYFGLAFIATFFNVCVVFTTKTRLSGGDATFGQSLAFAFSRIHLIAAWSVVSATVGLILHAIERAGRGRHIVAKIILTIVRMLLATAWGVTTVFVIPAMVYKGLGPVAAIKESLQTLRTTWGEGFVGYYGLNLAAFVCMIGPILLCVAGGFVCQAIPVLGLIMIGVGCLALLVVSTLFNMASTIYRTALYHWAAFRTVPVGVDPSLFQTAFRY